MVDQPRPDHDELPSPDDPADRAGDAADWGLDQFEAVADEQGISLDELGKAYAQLMGRGEDPYEPADDVSTTATEQVVDQSQDHADDESCELCPRSIVEAILFVGHPANEPMSSERLAELMRGVPPREIDELIRELNDGYREQGHPYQIVSVGAGYRMELCEEFAALRSVFYGRVREARLSQAATDVLAVVAYQPGLTRVEIDAIRGRPSGGLLGQLVRRRLLRIERGAGKPRTPRYHTTRRFLELFGIASLEDLPQSQDVE